MRVLGYLEFIFSALLTGFACYSVEKDTWLMILLLTMGLYTTIKLWIYNL